MKKCIYICCLAVAHLFPLLSHAGPFVSIAVTYRSGSGDALYALTSNGNLFIKEPNAANWSPLGNVGGGTFVDLTVSHHSNGVEDIFALTSNGDVYTKRLDGQFWGLDGNIFASSSPGEAVSICVSNRNNEGNYLYVMSSDGCVFTQDVGGANWVDTGCVLGATEAKTPSWGHLKSLYR